MSLLNHMPKVDARSLGYSISNFQEQSNAFTQEVTTDTKSMYVDNPIAGLGDVSTTFGASQIYRVPHHIPIGAEPRPIIIDGFYPLQPQASTMEATSGRRSATSSRKIRRMIKNRESAARSRARRQAYTSQLEIEIKHLKEENDMLKENLKSLYNDVATPPQTEKKPQTSTSVNF